MYDVLSDSIYWLNSCKLSFSDSITISKNLYYNILFHEIIFCSKKMNTVQVIKATIMPWIYSS